MKISGNLGAVSVQANRQHNCSTLVMCFEWVAASGVVSTLGIEPRTHALKVRCSTD
jgi:hypothetical protein